LEALALFLQPDIGTNRLVRDDVRAALAITRSSTMADRTVDITTTGRRSGKPRRIEICFYAEAD
jgi:hypothetical protein